jgi:hypothetical protein
LVSWPRSTCGMRAYSREACAVFALWEEQVCVCACSQRRDLIEPLRVSSVCVWECLWLPGVGERESAYASTYTAPTAGGEEAPQEQDVGACCPKDACAVVSLHLPYAAPEIVADRPFGQVVDVAKKESMCGPRLWLRSAEPRCAWASVWRAAAGRGGRVCGSWREASQRQTRDMRRDAADVAAAAAAGRKKKKPPASSRKW